MKIRSHHIVPSLLKEDDGDDVDGVVGEGAEPSSDAIHISCVSL